VLAQRALRLEHPYSPPFYRCSGRSTCWRAFSHSPAAGVGDDLDRADIRQASQGWFI
jgi:hypothetical protein